MTSDLANFSPLISLIVCAVVLGILLRYPTFMLDEPNQRSLHLHPVPRTGGIGITLGAFPFVAYIIPQYRTFCIAALAIAVLSLMDDWRHLSAAVRFGFQILIVTAVVILGFDDFSVGEQLFMIATILWLANLYNFMDGSDGLAAGMALFGFGTLSAGAWLAGNPTLSLLCASIACASAAFLWVNFHPARMFMGDVGAITLGFSAGGIGVIGWGEGTWSPFFPIFAFSPFIADASLTLMRRILQKQRFWEPHRDHYFQKLVRLGWGHKKTALAEYGAMAISGALGLGTLFADGTIQLLAVIVWGGMLMAIAKVIDSAWNDHQRMAG